MRFALPLSQVFSRSRRLESPSWARTLPPALALTLLLSGLTGCASPEITGNPPPTARAVTREEVDALSTPAARRPTPAEVAQPIAAEPPREEKKGWMPRIWPFGGKKEDSAPASPDAAVADARPTSGPAPKPEAVPEPAPEEATEEKKPGFLSRAVGVLPFVTTGDEINPPPPLPRDTKTRTVLPEVPKNQRVRARSKELRGLEMLVTVDPVSPRASLDRRISVGIVLYNSGKDSVSLRFGSTQTRELMIRGANGAVITRWSEDYVFDRSLTSLVVNPGERIVYNETISTRDLSAGQQYLLDVGIQGYSELQLTLPVNVQR